MLAGLQEIAEGDFLKVVTETQRVVVHFFHREFTRCKIMDKHLAAMTRKFFGTRFVKVSAPVRSCCLPAEHDSAASHNRTLKPEA